MFCYETFKKWGETLDHVSCTSLHFFRALTESCVLFNNTEQSRLFCLFYYKEPFKFPSHYFQFSKQTIFPKQITEYLCGYQWYQVAMHFIQLFLTVDHET